MKTSAAIATLSRRKRRQKSWSGERAAIERSSPERGASEGAEPSEWSNSLVPVLMRSPLGSVLRNSVENPPPERCAPTPPDLQMLLRTRLSTGPGIKFPLRGAKSY